MRSLWDGKGARHSPGAGGRFRSPEDGRPGRTEGEAAGRSLSAVPFAARSDYKGLVGNGSESNRRQVAFVPRRQNRPLPTPVFRPGKSQPVLEPPFFRQVIDIVAAKADAMSTAFLSGPKPGVDYDAMAADAPKITAMLEYIDRSLFQATPAIFAMLIDDKPDRQGMGRLSITRAERDRLVRSLRISFGKKLDQHDQNLIVSSASVLRDYLAKKATNAPMSRCEHPQPQRLPDRW